MLTTLVALIGLVKIKVFLKYLGVEATGIYQLFNQILSYVSLVDAGLTSSLLYSLYKPVSDNDTKKINSILKGGKQFYTKVAILIIIVGILLSLKIDFFLSDYTLPLFYIKICFILFIISNAINYLVTSQKVILEARQNLYKVHLVVYIAMIVKGLLEILLLTLNLKLLSLIVLLLIISIIQNIVIIFISKRDYADLDYKNVEPDTGFVKETKNLFIQKLANIIFNNVDIILISKFINSASIVVYTSYSYITNSIQNVILKIGSSSLASIGNLLVSEKNKARDVFYEYNSMCFYIANIVCIPLAVVITPFVSLFYGNQFTMNFLGSFCVVLITYIKIIEIPFDVFTSALGYFGKIKNCIIFQSIVNLVLSVILIFRIGISGVLLATVISYLVGEFAIYPYILNNNYFKKCKIKYYKTSFRLILIGIINYAIMYIAVKKILIKNLFIWFVVGLVCFAINSIIVTIYYKVINEDKFFQRLLNLLKERRKSSEKKHNIYSN